MNLSAAEIAILEAGSHRIGIFFRLETEPAVRLWFGFGYIATPADALDVGGATYRGFGEIANIPATKQMINGKAERVEFTLSGVDGDILAIASGGDAQQVKGKRVLVGFAFFDEAWQLVGPIRWCANYTADFIGLQQAGGGMPEDPIVRTITLSCGSLMTARRRPSLSYFSNQDQQRRHPGDRFCERVAVYANGFNKAWPVF